MTSGNERISWVAAAVALTRCRGDQNSSVNWAADGLIRTKAKGWFRDRVLMYDDVELPVSFWEGVLLSGHGAMGWAMGTFASELQDTESLFEEPGPVRSRADGVQFCAEDIGKLIDQTRLLGNITTCNSSPNRPKVAPDDLANWWHDHINNPYNSSLNFAFHWSAAKVAFPDEIITREQMRALPGSTRPNAGRPPKPR